MKMATMSYTCGKTVVEVERVVDIVRSAGAAIMRVYNEDAKVRLEGGTLHFNRRRTSGV